MSVLREIRKVLPGAEVHYLADSAYCPYGPRPVEEIRARTAAITQHFLGKGVGVVVVACNSATISAIEFLRAEFPLPFIGMEPAVKPAAAMTKTGTIGVMATQASLAGEKFLNLLALHAGELRVITRPCPEFVRLVERGELTGPEAERAVALHTDALLGEGADVLILGCSHYPFLRPLIEERCAGRAQVIDTGAPVSARLLQVLKEEGMVPRQGGLWIETTSDAVEAEALVGKLLTEDVSQVTHVDLG